MVTMISLLDNLLEFRFGHHDVSFIEAWLFSEKNIAE